MGVQLTHTVSILELLWTLMTLAGFVVSLRNLFMVIEDMGILRNHGTFIVNGPRHIIAKSRIRTEGIKSALMFGFILAGLMAMTVPSNPRTGTINPAALTITSVFIIGAMLVIADSFLYERDRAKVIEFYQHIPDPIQIKEEQDAIRHGRLRKY